MAKIGNYIYGSYKNHEKKTKYLLKLEKEILPNNTIDKTSYLALAVRPEYTLSQWNRSFRHIG